MNNIELTPEQRALADECIRLYDVLKAKEQAARAQGYVGVGIISATDKERTEWKDALAAYSDSFK